MEVFIIVMILVIFLLLPLLHYCSIVIDKDLWLERIRKASKRLRSFLECLFALIIVVSFLIFMLGMSFIPYEPTTQEDIMRMELREQIRYEQMILGGW